MFLLASLAVAEAAKAEEDRRARLAIHNGTALMRLLVETDSAGGNGALRSQAEVELNRMRAYLSGQTPPPVSEATNLAAVVTAVGAEFDDLPITVVADLAQDVALPRGLGLPTPLFGGPRSLPRSQGSGSPCRGRRPCRGRDVGCGTRTQRSPVPRPRPGTQTLPAAPSRTSPTDDPAPPRRVNATCAQTSACVRRRVPPVQPTDRLPWPEAGLVRFRFLAGRRRATKPDSLIARGRVDPAAPCLVQN